MNAIDDVNAYLSGGIEGVKGWCSPALWQAIWPLRGLIGAGPIGEIGVYHGKFFIGLAKTFDADGPHAALDLFDGQDMRFSGEEESNEAVFDANLSANGLMVDKVVKVAKNSMDLSPADTVALNDRFGGFKFFSVDGGHDVAHTINDLEFAMSVTHDDGVIALDDYQNPNWPGVAEGVARMFLMREDYDFVPAMLVVNKLFLCHRARREDYITHVLQHVKRHYPDTRRSRAPRFGYDTLNLMPRRTRAAMLVYAD